jgi:hypothetical protein
MSKRIDYTGRRFGIATVVGFAGCLHGKSRWLLRCDCGVFTIVLKGNLDRGVTTSCGDKRHITRKKIHYKHGFGKSIEYRAWSRAKGRCTLETDGSYHNYGARGIKMCMGWLANPAAFCTALGKRPIGHSLDRKDVNGHYSCGQCDECKNHQWPMNCRWASKTTQNNNTRQNKFITFRGKTQTVSEWARELKMPYKLFYYKLYRKVPDLVMEKLVVDTPQITI